MKKTNKHKPNNKTGAEQEGEEKGQGYVWALLAAGIVLLALNQLLIIQLNSIIIPKASAEDFSNIDFTDIKSTGHSIAAFFPVKDIKTAQDAIDIMIPTGTPDYGDALGVSYDDPVEGLSVLAPLDRKVQLSEDEFQRYLNIVTKPVGISCEFCCGVGAVGVNSQGKSICGCQHNPALLGLTKWLIKNTDYSDGQIIKEALKWKTLFFPKDMVNLALKVAGGDTSQLEELPGMVGGC